MNVHTAPLFAAADLTRVDDLRTVSPAPHKYSSLGRFRAVVVRDFSTGRVEMVKNPVGIYLGKNGVTVKGANPADTVRMTRDADITHTEV